LLFLSISEVFLSAFIYDILIGVLNVFAVLFMPSDSSAVFISYLNGLSEDYYIIFILN